MAASGSSAWQKASGYHQLPPSDQQRCTPVCYRGTGDPLKIQWLGHSTFVLETAEIRLWIDPVFSRTVSILPRRFTFGQQQETSSTQRQAILLSHAHMDHFDLKSLHALGDAAPIVLPDGAERFLSPGLRQRPLQHMRTGSTLSLEACKLTAHPARHGGWRYPWQRGLFALSYWIEFKNGPTVYYAGDTAYGPHFKAVANHHRRPPDIAILPIGAYSPRFFFRNKHMNPEEAVTGALDLGRPRLVIPCHFGTFRLTLESPAEALPRFAAAAAQSAIDWQVPVPA